MKKCLLILTFGSVIGCGLWTITAVALVLAGQDPTSAPAALAGGMGVCLAQALQESRRNAGDSL